MSLRQVVLLWRDSLVVILVSCIIYKVKIAKIYRRKKALRLCNLTVDFNPCLSTTYWLVDEHLMDEYYQC